MKRILCLVVSLVIAFSLFSSASAITVTKITSLQLKEKSVSLYLGDAYSLRVVIQPVTIGISGVKFSTSNDKVVTVDKTGKLTAKGTGVATVTVASATDPNVSARCNVVVAKAVISVTSYLSGPNNENSYAERWIESRFNVDWKFSGLDRSTYDQLLSVRLAGGEIPDLFLGTATTQAIAYSIYNMGVVAPVTVAQIKKYAPNFYNALLEYNKTYNCQLFAVARFDPDHPQNLYELPGIQYTNINPMAMVVRKDWMDKVGVKTFPDTIAQYETLLDKFTNGDPDGNGKKDTYALTARGKDAPVQSFQSIFYAYGVGNWGVYVKQNGKVVPAYQTDGYKEALKKLNDWYKKGYINPEFITSDNKQYLSDMGSGKIGITENTTWYRYYGWPDDFLAAMKNQPSAVLEYVKPPKGPQGYYGLPVNDPLSTTMMLGIQVANQPNKLAKILQIIDVISTDYSAFTNATYGKEGTHYVIDKVSGVVYKPDYDSYDKRADVGSSMMEMSRTWGSIANQRKTIVPGANVAEVNEKSRNNIPQVTFSSYIYTPAVSDQEQDEMNLAASKQATIHNKWLVSFITGTKSVDNDWDEYMKELEDAYILKFDAKIDERAKRVQAIIDRANAEVNALK